MFFFFQAEDGIRDIGVTGVQTCALPIWEPSVASSTRVGKIAMLLNLQDRLLGVLPTAEAAPTHAIQEVDYEPEAHPHQEPPPRRHGQHDHEYQAGQDGQDGDHGNEGRPEGPTQVWLCPPEDYDAYGDQAEGEQGTDVNQRRKLLQVHKGRHNRHDHAGKDGDTVGGAEARVRPGKVARQKVVPAHREGDPALAQHQDHDDRGEPADRADRDQTRRPALAYIREHRRHRGLGVELIVRYDPGHDLRDQDVQYGADSQGADDPDGQVPLRVARLLRG